MSTEARIALVTGGARRVGAAIVRELHGAGCRVVIHCRRSRAEADALATELNDGRPDSAAVELADLADVAQCVDLVARAGSRWGRLDVLVNNASAFRPTAVGETTEADWDELFASNAKAPFFLSQAAAPSLARHGGSVVNLIDIHAARPLKGHPVYCAAKAALAMLTRSLARELGPAVRVNGVAPGAVAWPENGLPDHIKAQIVDAAALKRAGTPEDVAGAVRFLALDAPFITGQIIAVDGGRF